MMMIEVYVSDADFLIRMLYYNKYSYLLSYILATLDLTFIPICEVAFDNPY